MGRDSTWGQSVAPLLSPEATPSEAGAALGPPRGSAPSWDMAGASRARGAGTCRWTERLPGFRATVVLNSTAHFSSVTDSEPFRSQRLIFFSS